MSGVMRIILLSMTLVLSACGGGDGGKPTVSPTSLTLDKTNVDLTTNASTQSVVASFQGDGLVVGSLPGTSVPSWLFVSTPSSTNPATVNISANGLLSPGRYSTTLRFATGKADGSNVVFKDVSVTYTVDHILSPSKLQPSVVAGATGSAVSTTLSLVTNGATWEATSNQPWITVTPSSGTGSASLNVSSNTALTAGTYTATITVRDTLTNRTQTTVIDLIVNPRRLEVQPRGVALSSTAGASVTTRTVKVIDTANLGGHWTATDDAAWLQIVPSVGAGTLTLTASDVGLADGIYYATVTVAPDAEPGLSNSRDIRVGFYVNHTAPAPPASIVTANILGASSIVADPIRPYAYVAQTSFDTGTSTFNGAVLVYNFHTGQQVDSIPFPGRILTGLAISPDGGMLIAADTANSSVASDRFLIPITLNGSNRSVGSKWPNVTLGLQYSYFKVAEINGASVLLTGNKQIVSMSNGAILGNFESDAVGAFVFSGTIAVSPDGTTAMICGVTNGNHRIGRYRLSNTNGTIRALETHNLNESGNGLDVASDASGSKFITLSEDPTNSLRLYDRSNFTVTKSAITGASAGGTVDVASNGDIYVTGRQGYFVQFDANLQSRGSRSFSPSDITYYGRVSGDGLRTVVLSAGTSGVADSHLNFFSSQL